jgi:hypothetical protein
MEMDEMNTINVDERTEIKGGEPIPKVKRKPSAYNIFMGKCMRSGKDMKACATEYREKKGRD